MFYHKLSLRSCLFTFFGPFFTDLIGEEFAPKRSQSQQPSVIVEAIGGSSDHIITTTNSTAADTVVPVSTMSQQLGPNVVFVNTSGGSGGVPLQVQQIIQQAQQQVRYIHFCDTRNLSS